MSARSGKRLDVLRASPSRRGGERERMNRIGETTFPFLFYHRISCFCSSFPYSVFIFCYFLRGLSSSRSSEMLLYERYRVSKGDDRAARSPVGRCLYNLGNSIKSQFYHNSRFISSSVFFFLVTFFSFRLARVSALRFSLPSFSLFPRYFLPLRCRADARFVRQGIRHSVCPRLYNDLRSESQARDRAQQLRNKISQPKEWGVFVSVYIIASRLTVSLVRRRYQDARRRRPDEWTRPPLEGGAAHTER